MFEKIYKCRRKLKFLQQNWCRVGFNTCLMEKCQKETLLTAFDEEIHMQGRNYTKIIMLGKRTPYLMN